MELGKFDDIPFILHSYFMQRQKICRISLAVAWSELPKPTWNQRRISHCLSFVLGKLWIWIRAAYICPFSFLQLGKEARSYDWIGTFKSVCKHVSVLVCNCTNFMRCVHVKNWIIDRAHNRTTKMLNVKHKVHTHAVSKWVSCTQ